MQLTNLILVVVAYATGHALAECAGGAGGGSYADKGKYCNGGSGTATVDYGSGPTCLCGTWDNTWAKDGGEAIPWAKQCCNELGSTHGLSEDRDDYPRCHLKQASDGDYSAEFAQFGACCNALGGGPDSQSIISSIGLDTTDSGFCGNPSTSMRGITVGSYIG